MPNSIPLLQPFGNACYRIIFARFRHLLGTQLSFKICQWIQKCLDQMISFVQIMVEHNQQVLELSISNEALTNDICIMLQDVYNLSKKKAQELWKKHPINA